MQQRVLIQIQTVLATMPILMMMAICLRCDDAFPLDATEIFDTDSDGTGNNADTDDDGDSVLDGDDAFP